MSEVNKIGWKQKIDLERPVALFFNFFFDCRVLREKAHRNIINSTAARDVLNTCITAFVDKTLIIFSNQFFEDSQMSICTTGFPEM
jgi:hypothetical protein